MIVAIKATSEGDVSDVDKFVKALSEVSFQAPHCYFEFESETNTAILDYYLVKVVREDDGFGYEVLEKYPRRIASPWCTKLYSK